MGAANSPSPAPLAVQDAASNSNLTATTTTTASASATENNSAIDASPQQQPQQLLSSPSPTNANSATGKRKRSDSPSASITSTQQRSPSKKKPDDPKKSDSDSMMITTIEDRASQRLLFMEATMRDLLTVLKSNDPTPSILRHPIPNSTPSSSSGAPPIKRTKISPSSPNTIAEKLLRVTYTSLTTLLSDISAVCRELLTSTDNERPNGALINGASSIGSGSGLPFVAQVIHFEELAKQVITRERVRRADLFDFVEDMSGDSVTTKPVGGGGKVALTVMGHHGPLFSSLQNPINPPPVGDSVPSSRSTSASASPKSSTSTAPTSTATSPKAEPLNECPVYAPLNESHLPPLISTVKAIPSNAQILRGVKKLPGKEEAKVSTLGEAFPAPRGLPPLLPPKPAQPGTVGLRWGGKIGIGGVRVENPLNDRPEGCGSWLSYKNNMPPNHPLTRHEPPRSRAPLAADLVAAYSSFAPTRDDSGSKIPAAIRNRVWWDRAGKQLFAREFADDPSLRQMCGRYDKKVTMAEAQTEEMDLDEEFRKLIDDWEPDKEIPIDVRLLDGTEGAEATIAGNKANEENRADVDTAGSEDDPEKILSEISSLLQSLRSQQFTRLSTVPHTQPFKPGTGNPPPVPGTPLPPNEEEVGLYNTIRDRLAQLISKLPPHVVATIDGDPSSDLALSSKIPVLGGPIFKGTLPADESQPPKLSTPQVQGAAMAAMNAAAGLSPVNSAPVAHMSSARSQHHHHHTPTTSRPMSTLPNISVGAQYHGHQMPHYHGHTIPSVTTPHHYPSPYAPAPSPMPTPTPQGQYQPPPPRIVSPLNHRQPAPQQQFHGHSLPAQTYQNPPPAYQTPPPPRRTGVPPPQGLAAVGVGYSSPAYNNNAGLRMGVQHTQQSMGPGAMPGGRYTGRRR